MCTKICNNCLLELPIEDFIKRSKKSPKGFYYVAKCKNCRLNELQAYGIQIKPSRQLKFVTRVKSVFNICVDCGSKYAPHVLDFDHVRGEKIENLSRLVYKTCDMALIKDEIRKCDIVCANCHRERTYRRQKCSTI